MPKVNSIYVSDLHIGTCPVARSKEPDWLAAMQRSFDELKSVQKSYRGVPVVIVGDIFDRYSPPAEIVNFAIRNLPPNCYAIVGNHDLPNHNIGEINRSAYQTLVEAGVLRDLTDVLLFGDDLTIHPFPWGRTVVPLQKRVSEVHVAVIHKYIWKEGFGHPGAKEELSVGRQRESLMGYDAVFYGDNHGGFLVGQPGQQQIMNCGTFFRRKSDEVSYKPQIGLLWDDGSVTSHYLDVSKDVFIETFQLRAKIDSSSVSDLAASSLEFVESIRELETDSLDFREVVRRKLDEVDVEYEVRRLVLSAIE